MDRVLADSNNFSLAAIRKIEYGDKKVQVIYNPNSGKKINIKQRIKDKFAENGIRYDIFETQGKLDSFFFIRDQLDIESCSALVLVGGDGTIHEGINGLMSRQDKKKVPIGYIPNGSGNDNCRGFCLFEVDRALDYLIKGHLIRIDLIKVLLDYETEEELD